MIQIPVALQTLADQFLQHGWPLYGVGGMVRNQLLSYPISDIDICGPILPADVLAFAKEHHYHTVPKAVDFGSIEIHLPTEEGTLITEYTTFRKDTYGQTGHHRPKGVIFSTNIEYDAFRRDFSVNALYYDLQNHVLLDPCHGLPDLNHKILRTTSPDPAIILRDDGLRILRLVRFACELGFSIDPTTQQCAQDYAVLLSDIPVERIWNEFQKILLSDVRYHAPSPQLAPAHYRGLKLLEQLGALEYIIPELYEGKNLIQTSQYHAYDVMEHNLISCAESAPIFSVRLASLLHDIGKPFVWNTTGRMLYHDRQGATMTKDILTRLKAPTELTHHVAELVNIHMFDLDGKARPNTIKRFFAQIGITTAEEFILVREADFVGSGKQQRPIPSAERFRAILANMIQNNVPFSVNDLAISGDDIINILNIPAGKQVGLLKNKLWLHCVYYPNENTPKRLAQLTKQYYKQLVNQSTDLQS